MSAEATFRDLLEGARRVHVDARVICHYLMADPRFLELTRVLFRGLRTGTIRGQTSALSFYQLFSEIYRRDAAAQADEVAKLLTIYPGLVIVSVTAEVALQAAEVRAQLGGRTERAVQIASALGADADVYLTEGSGLRRIAQMNVVNLEDYAARPITRTTS